MLKAIHSIGQGLSGIGRQIDGLGRTLGGAYTERLVLSENALSYKTAIPETFKAAFVAPTATILGDVKVGAGSSVGWGATIRGDVNFIQVGEGTAIGDNAVVGNGPVIGNGVSIGAGATVHACALADGAVVGAGAVVLDGAALGEGAAVAPGSIVSPNTQVPAGELWAGVPARRVRALGAAEAARARAGLRAALQHAAAAAAECAKPWEQVLLEEEAHEDLLVRDDPLPVSPKIPTEVDGVVPGRIFNNRVNS